MILFFSAWRHGFLAKWWKHPYAWYRMEFASRRLFPFQGNCKILKAIMWISSWVYWIILKNVQFLKVYCGFLYLRNTLSNRFRTHPDFAHARQITTPNFRYVKYLFVYSRKFIHYYKFTVYKSVLTLFDNKDIWRLYRPGTDDGRGSQPRWTKRKLLRRHKC